MMWNVTGHGGPSQIMFQQLRPGNSYAKISWQDLFAAMKVYCERYSLGPEQQVNVLYFRARLSGDASCSDLAPVLPTMACQIAEIAQLLKPRNVPVRAFGPASS